MSPLTTHDKEIKCAKSTAPQTTREHWRTTRLKDECATQYINNKPRT